MIGFFHDTLYQPLYNGLIFLIDVIPGADVGIAVVGSLPLGGGTHQTRRGAFAGHQVAR